MVEDTTIEVKRAKTCSGCVHFAALAQECRKGPPSVFPMMTQPGQVQFVGTWPPTKESNWCGAFEAPRDD